MMKQTWKPYLFGILFTEAVGGLAALLTRDATEIYNSTIVKPALSPPAIVFPIVWAILYALMGIGAARVWMTPLSPARKRSLRLFLVQLGFNFFWSILFFNFQAFGLAFFWLAALWILIVRMTLSFYEVDRLAAWLQVPYLLWVLFAAYLNFGVWKLN
jgi:tryptophan-rich sensory protein